MTTSTGDELAILSFDVDPSQNEFSTEVREALDRLPNCLRETFLLVAVQDFTHKEAATRLGIPIGTALSRVSKARKRLHDYLSDFRG